MTKSLVSKKKPQKPENINTGQWKLRKRKMEKKPDTKSTL